MDDTNGKKTLQKWLRSKQKSGLRSFYKKAQKNLLARPEHGNLRPNCAEAFEISTHESQKIFCDFFSVPIYCPETLNSLTNILLLNFFFKKYEFEFSISTAKIGELNQYFKALVPLEDIKLLDVLYEFKQQFAEQVLFLKFLECCLDEEPSDRRFEFQLELSPRAEKIISSNLDSISNDDIHNVLDGIKLFFNTSEKNIRCIPKHASILLKSALPCWIFLALNLPSNEMPTENKISRLLKAATPEEGRKQYPAIDKFLKPICAAYYLYLDSRAGKPYADSVVEKYGLSDYIPGPYEADQILLQSQNKFVKAAIQSTLKRKNKPVLRGWTQRDHGTYAFDRQLQSYAVSTDLPEDEFDRFMKMALKVMDPLNNDDIQSVYRHLILYQTIVSSVKCYTVDGKKFHANETLNLILFEYITGFVTLANFGSACPNSFYIPPLSDAALFDLTGTSKEERTANPFYRLNANNPLTKHLNELYFYENDLAAIDRLRKELLHMLDISKVVDKLNQIDPMAGHLNALLALTSPLPKTVDA